MTGNRATITTLMLLVLAAAAVSAPTNALAGPLLSGYGGPGQGSQEILGSALLGAPPSGGGGGSTGGGGATTGAVSSAATGAKAPVHGAVPARQGARTGAGRVAKASGERPRPYAQTTYGQTSSQASVGGSPTLGLSEADLLDMLLVLGALALTGGLTARLARRTR
jgi:hypothetical protein